MPESKGLGARLWSNPQRLGEIKHKPDIQEKRRGGGMKNEEGEGTPMLGGEKGQLGRPRLVVCKAGRA